MPLLCRLCTVLALLALTAGGPALAAADGAPLRVALLLENPPGDHGWNDGLLDGLHRAGRELAVHTAVMTASPGAGPEALQELFRQAARNNDLVLVASDRLHETLRNNAANFRRTLFGCIDAGVRAPNIMSITFADEQAAFLAGAAAAMLTTQTRLPGINTDKTLGWIGGEDVPAMRSLLNGFTEGARSIDPEMRVITMIVGSFAQTAASRKAAQDLLDQGADVLALASGTGNAAVLEEVAARRAYAVGLDTDQDNLLPGRILTSILKHPDQAVFDIVAAAAAGRFQGREILVRDLKNKGVGITDMAAFKAAAGKNAPPDLERRLRELRGEILNGGVRLKSLRARTLCDCQ